MKKIAILFMVIATLASFISCNSDFPSSSSETVSSTTTEITTTETTRKETEAADDGFEAVRNSKELWMSYGLEAYLAEKEVPNLTAFFAEPTNMSYMTLYADMFYYDKEHSVPVAEAFFCFIVDEYGIKALTDMEKRIEYKSAFFASLGLDTKYTQSPDVEALLSRMTVTSDKDWKYIITIDNTTYHLNDFSQGGIAQYHALFYYHTSDLATMIDHIEKNMPEQKLDTDRHFDYYLTFDGSNVSYTKADGKMYINESYSMLHESLHAMGLGTNATKHWWLSEGLCNYLGKLSGFATQYTTASLQIMKTVASGAWDARAESGNISAIFYKSLYEAYRSAGGSIASAAEFDAILYNDLWATLERDMLGDQFITIGDTYKMLNWYNSSAIGLELSYGEATSLVTYLIQHYGMEQVLKAYNTQNIDSSFGKSYEELKILWQESLIKAK